MMAGVVFSYSKHPLWQRYKKICRIVGEGWLSIVPDFGIIVDTPHKLWRDQAIGMGFRPNEFTGLVERHKNGVSLENEVMPALFRDCFVKLFRKCNILFHSSSFFGLSSGSHKIDQIT